jgi:hypothetical protein
MRSLACEVLVVDLFSYHPYICTDREAALLRNSALHAHDVPCLTTMKRHDARGRFSATQFAFSM